MSPVDPALGRVHFLAVLCSKGSLTKPNRSAWNGLVFATSLDLCRYTLGQIYSAQGRYDEAVEIHEQIPVERSIPQLVTGDQLRLSPAAMTRLSPLSTQWRSMRRREINSISRSPTRPWASSTRLTTWMNVAYESRADWLAVGGES